MLCSISTKEREDGVTPKFWWHKACIDAKMNTDERLAKFGPKFGFTVRYDCECCHQEMQLVELDDQGRFVANSKCAGKRPPNMIEAAGKINLVAGAGNYVARLRKKTRLFFY